MKSRYIIALSLNEQDRDKTEKLRKQKVKLIEIYRKGLEALAVKQRTIPV